MKSRFIQVMLGILVVATMVLPAYLPVVAYTWQEPVDVPVWIAGDTWKYWTVSHKPDVTTQQLAGGLMTLTLTQTYISDNTTYTSMSGTFKEESYDTYKQTVSGNADFSGTYYLKDNLGMGGDENGCFSGTATNNGQQYKRISDLAFVKATLTINEVADFYLDCTATPSPSLGTGNAGGGPAETVASPPIDDLKFPMKTGLDWDTSSTVSTKINPGTGTEEDHTTVYQFNNHVNGTKSHTVDAGTFTAFEIYETGTETKDSVQSTLEQSAYYAPDVKNFIDKTQDGEKLMQYTVHFYPDLMITQYNISIDTDTPVQGLPAKVNATIWNIGHEDANNFKAELWVGSAHTASTKIDSVDVTSVQAGKSTNVSFSWTPADVGINNIKVLIDTTSAIQEYSEANNMAQINVTVSEPLPDLAISASDLTVPSQVPIETLQTIKAIVHNLGNKAATNVMVRFFDGSTQIGGDQTYTAIDQGATIEASAVWSVAGLGGHTIRVESDPNTAIKEINENNNDASVAVNVIQLNYSFSMTVPISQKTVKPNETAQFQINIKNTGKKQDTVNFIVSPPPENWIASYDKNSLLLAPGSTQPVILSVTPPVGTLANTVVNLTAQASSQGDSNYKQTASLTTTVKKMAGTSSALKTSTQALAGIPGATVSYDFTIENTGNAPDTFTLSIDSQWATNIKGGSTTNELQPKAKQTITLETTVPITGMAGDKNIVTLTVKSTMDQTYQRDSTAVITCLQVYDLSVAVTPVTLDVNPGESATFTIKLGNDGNGDDIVNTTIVSTPDIPQDWTVTYDQKTTIKAGKDKDVLVTLTTPKTALAQDYAITFNVVGSSGDKVQKPVTLTVKQVYELDLSAATPTAQVKAGKMVVLTVTVKNTGNGDDTVQMTANNLDPKLTATFSEQEFKLAPGASKDVTVTIAAKSSSSGTKPVEIKATSKDGKVSDSTTVNLDIKALPQGNNLMIYLLVVIIIIGVAGAAAVIWYKRTH